MITKERRQNTLREHPKRTATEPNRSAPGKVDREGGEFGAGLISGVSVITRGEALGHGFWIDAEFLEQVSDSLNEGSRKVRFKHPGLSSDGLGNALGKAFSGTVEGDKVLTEIHLLESAHDSPEGDLASYVMKLAEESPDLFGTSIVFQFDEDGTSRHGLDHGAKLKDGHLIWEEFKSPDELNTKNLPHARLDSLRAVDVVDEPAANPAGMFSSLGEEGQMVEQFEAIMEYALGLSDVVPADSDFFPFSPERVRSFTERFAESRGMELKFTKTNTMFDKNKKQALETHIADLESQLDSQGSELKSALEQVSELTEKTIAAKAAADAASDQDEPAESLEESVKGLSAEVKELRAELCKLDEKAEAKAIEKLSELGHPPVEVPDSDEVEPGKDLNVLAEYEAIEDAAEKRKFLGANAREIHKLAKAQS